MSIHTNTWQYAVMAGGYHMLQVVFTRPRSAQGSIHIQAQPLLGTMDLFSPQIHAQRVRQAPRPSNPFAPDTEQGQPQE